MIKLNKKKVQEKQQQEEEKKGSSEDTQVKKTTGSELRLKKEILEIDIPAHAKLKFPDDKEITNMQLFVDLTKESSSLWKGGVYEFSIKVEKDYPFGPPKCLCKTKIYHPNIDLEGHVCLNILRDDWKPVLGINAVILGLIFLFVEPNPNDPLNHEAAERMRKSQRDFETRVKQTLRGGTIDGVTYEKFI